MSKRASRSLVEILIILTVGAGIAWAGSQGGSQVGEVPLFALCAAIALLANGLAGLEAGPTQPTNRDGNHEENTTTP